MAVIEAHSSWHIREKRVGMVTRERASWQRIVKALILGHLAAACSFSALATGFVSIVDPDGSRAIRSGAVLEVAKIAAMYGLISFIAILPFSLLTAPFTCFAARRLRGSAGLAVAVGALVGAAECGGLLAMDGGFRGPWSRAGLPGDPRSDMMIAACGVAAGMGYAWMVWRLCIRPYTRVG